MDALTIILFFVYSYGLGFAITSFLKNSDNFLENNLMRLGFGLASFVVLGTFLNLLHIPLDFRIFLVLSIAYPLFFAVKKKKKLVSFMTKLRPRATKTNLAIILVLLMFAFTFYMYHKGAFSYPWFEDGDPWVHAGSIKYVAVEKTVYEPDGLNIMQYIDSYPPGYEMLMAVLYQSSGMMMWTMKFFNALIISLGIIFFFFLAKELMGSKKAALFSTFILTVAVSYMSHFIWSHSLAVMLIFPLLYSLEMIKYDKKWYIAASVCYAAILLTQPTKAFKISVILLIYLVVKTIMQRKLLWHHYAAPFLGGIASLILWWVPMGIKYGLGNIAKATQGLNEKALEKGFSTFKFKGTADRVYTFNDFFYAKETNMINNPIGVGSVLMCLFMLTVLILIILQFYKTIKNKKELSKLTFLFLVLSEISSFILFWLSFFSPLNLIKSSDPALGIIEAKFGIALSVVLFVICFALISVNYMIFYIKQLEKKEYLPIVLLWVAFAVFGIHGQSLPVQLWAFRFWMLFAIFLSLLMGEFFLLFDSFRRFSSAIKYGLLAIILIGLWFTSGSQKYSVNTALWFPDGGHVEYGQMQEYVQTGNEAGYLWLKTIPNDAKIYYYCGWEFGDYTLISYDKDACFWCNDTIEFRKDAYNKTIGQFYEWAKSREYQYVLLDGHCVSKSYGPMWGNETNTKINELISTGYFQLAHQTSGVVFLSFV